MAAKFGILPSLLVSLLSVIAFNFFFTQPYYTLHVSGAGHYFTFATMLFTGLVIGSMASRLRLQAGFYRETEREQSHLFALAKTLSATRGHENMATEAARYIGEVFDAVITVWYPAENRELSVISGNDAAVDFRERSTAKWAFENGREAGFGTDTMPSAKGVYLPLLVEGQVIGVLGLMPSGAPRLDADDRRLLEAFAAILASSLKRATIAGEAEKQRVEMEGEKLRNVLLSSVSHDLRTPLASITGLSSSLLLARAKLPVKVKDTLRAIHDQSARLAKIVTNLLDISSLESGKVTLNKQPYFLAELIGSALLRLEETLKDRKVETKVSTGALIEMDGLLIEQVFINLLENTAKYAGEKATIRITVMDAGDQVEVAVSDNGPGISKVDISHVLEKFYKGPQGGLGLGLPICKAIVEVHGGRMWVENNETGGASFHFTLPKQQK